LLALIVELSKTDHERFVEAERLLIQCQLGGQVKMRVLTLWYSDSGKDSGFS